jgi:hypothetical protein
LVNLLVFSFYSDEVRSKKNVHPIINYKTIHIIYLRFNYDFLANVFQFSIVVFFFLLSKLIYLAAKPLHCNGKQMSGRKCNVLSAFMYVQINEYTFVPFMISSEKRSILQLLNKLFPIIKK